MFESPPCDKALRFNANVLGSRARILIVSEAEIATTQIIEQIVKACSAFGLTYQKRLLKNLKPGDFTPDTLPLFLRCSGPYAQLWSRVLADAGCGYAYYIDDNFWELTGDSPVTRYYRKPSIRRSLDSIITRAHTLITNSPELASVISQFNDRTIILPTFVDFSLLERLRSDRAENASNEIRIGFAGSAGRVDDLDLISNLVSKILTSHNNVIFEFIGVLPRNTPTGDRVRFFPHINNYEKYIEFQLGRHWDIALAPLLDHPANRCKSDVKYREYSALRYAGIYSNIPPYRDAVQNSVTGLLVNNTEEEWLEAISNLLSNRDKRTTIARQAFEDSRRRYDIPRVADKWAAAFLQIGAEQTNNLRPLKQVFLRREKLIATVKRIGLRIQLALTWLVYKLATKLLPRFLYRSANRDR
jgi:glycosyltransferase involved in cell wall biosynthesis